MNNSSFLCQQQHECTYDLIKDFQTLGCNDQKKCAVASSVFKDLKNANMTDVEKLYNEEMDLLYFRAKYSSEPTIIIPTAKDTEVNILQFEEIQRKLSGNLKCITMAICSPDSTISYFSITSGFKEK